MKVHFLLPTPGAEPVGGYKVVYEYANALAARGHQVVVSHAFRLHRRELADFRRPRVWLGLLKSWATGRFRPEGWFRIDPRVRLRLVPFLHRCFMPAADAVVATSWRTAEWVASFGARQGRPFYLIQHLEDWSGERERVLRTWTLPLHKIVIARWLADIANGLGQPSTYITNGLDFQAFGLDMPIRRRPPRIGMLFHAAAWKGSDVGLEAIRLAQARHPALQAVLFGVCPRPAGLPARVEYVQLPSPSQLRALYNSVSIFLGPSLTEGWGLPPAEAMMCGAAVVLTDIGGHREFAVAGENCLMVPAGDASALAEAIDTLVRDDEARIRLAAAGHASIQQIGRAHV